MSPTRAELNGGFPIGKSYYAQVGKDLPVPA